MGRAIYPLIDAKQQFYRWVGKWSNRISVLPASRIIDIVGVFAWGEERIHILRKHPGLSMLNAEDRGLEEEEGSDE